MGRAYQNRKDSMAKTAAAKTKVYSKYGRELYVCAKSGGPDPDTNAILKALIERAKKDQVPSHVIDRALEKARGGGGEDYAAARYEGYGPAGVAVIVECLTDNPTRTFNEVRTCFTKTSCKIGTAGSVAHTFDHLAIFVFAAADEEQVLEALLDGDIDVTNTESEDGKVTVFTPSSEYGKAKKAIVEAFGEVDFEVDEIQFVPQATSPITGDDVATLDKLLEMLEECDDVQRVYHSAER
ncbi:MAG: YebC/PmpR family DNA-binding transcriptional regulator [Planctomycetota bacterium]